ncbi:hypothetical protein F975_01875 [Acinetobacter sp. ANC 3789]|uniref:hypothetical protein n=1 Tax=Acinetobacter sp. ANC 3789 TaxID=1217714 RepID=UPI0002D08AF1|nr:hypothetical protein [Acinetobacter sp. ANC 3789]ENU80122.1 hypothetical protein F975_01875 [Acinetobacter sp. ANC 3789]
MKTCTILGDMSSDRASEQYPEVNVCDECIQRYKNSEDSPIVNEIGDYDSDYGEECALCEKHISEE